MKDVLAAVDAWTSAGQAVAIATVVGVTRSAPRPPGAKMAVSASGEIAGAVSGGCVEGAVVHAAEEVLAGGAPRLMRFGIADEEAWEVGLPCGGELSVWVERFGAREHEAMAAAARAGGRGALVRDLETAAGLYVSADGATEGSLGSAWLDDAARSDALALMWSERSELRGQTFVDVISPSPRLVIFGAIDFAVQLSRVARLSGWRPYVIDPRSRFASAERFPEAEAVVAGWPQEAVATIGGIDPATAIAVLSHDPKLDDEALLLALDSSAFYVGAMGSRRANERRLARLQEAGLTGEHLARLFAPIGLDLGAVSMEETAMSILSEIIAIRRGRGGGHLRDGRGTIHDRAGRQALEDLPSAVAAMAGCERPAKRV